MTARRAFALFLFAAGCFGLGLAVARWLEWGPPPASPPTSGLPVPEGSGPRIYIDAGDIVLHDGSLEIHPPPPPDVDLR